MPPCPRRRKMRKSPSILSVRSGFLETDLGAFPPRTVCAGGTPSTVGAIGGFDSGAPEGGPLAISCHSLPMKAAEITRPYRDKRTDCPGSNRPGCLDGLYPE